MERQKFYMSKTQEKKRRRKKFPNVFFKKELVALFDVIDQPKVAIASFLTFFCALRQSEIAKLKWQDIDLEEARLKVVDGKCSKDGFVPISSVCIPILKKWRAMNPDSEYFLPADDMENPYYKPDSLYRSYKKFLKKADLLIPTEKNASGYQQHQFKFHTLRHSRCTHLLSNGVPLQKVQHFMRHDKIETTMVYTWILDAELNQMVEEVDKKKPHERFFSQPESIMPVQAVTEDPVEIAKKRLAYGEISPREFKRILETLSFMPDDSLANRKVDIV